MVDSLLSILDISTEAAIWLMIVFVVVGVVVREKMTN